MNKIFLIIYFSYINNLIIKDAVYCLIYQKSYLKYENEILQISKNLNNQISCNFKIIKVSMNLNISFYYINHINTNLNLYYSQNSTINIKLSLRDIEEFDKWTFIEIRNNIYKIQNKNKCYIKVKNTNIICENISLDLASEFNIIKIYEEVNDNNLNHEILDKEPIDVLIKYIDLRDSSLKRIGIHQIKKDLDNEELRYSIRSILKNIPWIRKIFILMPNEKVRYFKEYNIIKDKIVYIKDSNFLGHDSANSLSFQFNLWKMKKFGISNNFILMDDDCFIGNPLNKSNFFYIKNGLVSPLIITYKFMNLNINIAKEKIKKYNKMIQKSNIEQSSAEFRYSLYSKYLFILKIFNKTSFIPVHTHNAIPVNIKELKEIYDIVYKSEFKVSTLDSLYRKIDGLQFQAFVLSYTFFKYNKKVKNISYKLIQNRDSIFSDYNFSLFCINTGSINYSPVSFLKTKIVMEYLFPIPSKYEIVNYSLAFITIKTIVLLDQEFNYYKFKKKRSLKLLEDQLIKYIKKIKILYFFTNLILFAFVFLWKVIFNSRYLIFL